MNKEELNAIKKWLPRGYGKTIFLETGISLVTIYSTLNGTAKNEKVLDVAIRIAQEEKGKAQAKQAVISTLEN